MPWGSDLASARIHRVRLHEPEVGGREVRFSWEVTPASDLYARTDGRLSFPPDLDLGAVPRALWWRLAMLCLHPHWALLRPCRVELPIRLGPGERDFWLRLIEATVINLVEYGAAPRPGAAVDLVESGPALTPVVLEGSSDRAAAAFSGGKDSLAQAALLAELCERPLLVTTCSPVPWTNDHSGAARERAKAEVVRRLPVELIEVHSDFRTCTNHLFAAPGDGKLMVHELADQPLFQAVTVAVAAASGISRSFMASEADIQYNAHCPSGVLQHVAFPASAVTLGSLDTLLRQFGLGLGSLTYPLHTPQVQGLLCRRYPELVDLQWSCWEALDGAQACSVCRQCTEIAFLVLAEGLSPAAVGIDPVRLLCTRAGLRAGGPATSRKLHETRAPQEHTWRAVRAVPVERLREILEGHPASCADPRLGEALEAYGLIHESAMALELPPAPGYIGGFLESIDSALRDPLRAIIEEHFEPAPEAEFAAILGRSRALKRRITEPLGRYESATRAPRPSPRAGGPPGEREA
ncbi:MAG TPA: hypothetical protein VIJ20_00775 [Solirubrobacteraceae bacterium]